MIECMLHVGSRDSPAYSPEEGTGMYSLHLPHHRGRQTIIQGEPFLGDFRRKETQPQLVLMPSASSVMPSV